MRSPLSHHWVVRPLWLSISAAVLAAVTVSRVYWGYWLWIPSMDTRILEAQRYVGIAFSGWLRVLHMLDLQGKLEAIPLKRTVELRTLSELVQGSGARVKPSPGYEACNTFTRGLAVEAEGHDGRRLLFVGLVCGQVSNDHYPLYEFLFEAAPGAERYQRVSTTQWFINVAGIEWHVMFLGFLPISLVIFLLSLEFYTAVHRSKPRSGCGTRVNP